MSNFIPIRLWVFIIAMAPFVELRLAIPIGYGQMPLWQLFSIAVIGNMIPVPLILMFFSRVEIFLRKFRRWNFILTRLFERTRRKASTKLRKYGILALLLFVAIPLPGTGAWTGSLIAYIFGLKFSRSLLVIFLGVLLAGIIVTLCREIFGRFVWP
jgi:uncharacterized membrane protein